MADFSVHLNYLVIIFPVTSGATVLSVMLATQVGRLVMTTALYQTLQSLSLKFTSKKETIPKVKPWDKTPLFKSDTGPKLPF